MDLRSTHTPYTIHLLYYMSARRRGAKRGTRLTTKTYYKRLRAKQLLKKANNVELNRGTIKGSRLYLFSYFSAPFYQ